MMDNNYSAAMLYDGGWRSGDRDTLIEYYDLSDDEADRICAGLKELEDEAEAEKAHRYD